ncbi:MAG: FG-GAP repeat protein [Bryobacteraceae bacterium]|nr:FG-GAP repeat protein [Bryobacteraceae bacterium]
MSFKYLPLLALFSLISGALAQAGKLPSGLNTADWAGIHAEYEKHRHAPVAVPGGYQARNAGQQWVTRFDGRGFTVRPDKGGWKWGLELRGYGFPSNAHTVAGQARMSTGKTGVTYHWDRTLSEWYVNDGRGLEHGFTLSQRPAGFGKLAVRLGVRGGLRARGEGAGVEFADPQGNPLVRYAGLKVWDADGKVLPARMKASGDELLLEVEEASARYPVTIDPVAQQAYLKASNTGAADQFGKSVAISGDTVVVGANGEDSSASGVNGNQADNSSLSSGAAYVFVRTGTAWSLQAYLKASNPDAGDEFGWSVSISGDTIVVGAKGEASSAAGVGGNQGDNSAFLAGAAYVFVRNSGVWSQQAYLKASNTALGDLFGSSVAISGDTIAVGAPSEGSSATGVNGNQGDNSAPGAGAVYIFVRNLSTWSQQAYLKASNTGTNDQFGVVALSGDTLVVGALFEASSATGVNGNQADNSAAQAGAAYVFLRSGTAWAQQAYLKASNTGSGDFFGISVGVSGDTAVVGALAEDSNATGVNGSGANNSAGNSGAAYVFVRSAGAWSQQAYLKASNTGANDTFGTTVAIAGETIVVGAPSEASAATGVDGNGADNSANGAGSAYVFQRSGGSWSQTGYLKASNTGSFDQFGTSVAVAGDTVVVGAVGEDSTATGIGGDQANNSAADAGAAYVYTITAPAPGLRFVPITPCRVADTRPGQGTTGNFGPPSMTANSTRDLPIPQGRCGIPSIAQAYSLNITVVPGGPFGFLTTWPTGQARPTVSTLNSLHGGIVANAAIVPAGTGGSVSVFVTDPADVIVDINGYFEPNSGFSFYTVDPCRLADTRSNSGFSGAFGAPPLAANTTRSFPLPSGSCLLPANAAAYSLNATVLPFNTLGFLTLFPSGQQAPFVSTLNSFDGAVVANAAIVPAGSAGAVSAFVTDAAELILDTNGYFGPAGAANELQFRAVTPCRVADTRTNGNGAPIMSANEQRDFTFAGKCGIPSGARAYSVNVTVVPNEPLGFLSLWPSGRPRPLVSTLNSFLGRIVANAALVPSGTNGAVSVFVTHPTHVILDVNGYFQ